MNAAEGLAPLTTSALPEEWDWSKLDASRPRRAIEHIAHGEVSPVTIDRLGPKDPAPNAKWELKRSIPIILMDTLDAYWVFERVINKLNGSAKTIKDAKADLVNKLAGHVQLLTSLESPQMAPVLRLELEFLRLILRPVDTAP